MALESREELLVGSLLGVDVGTSGCKATLIDLDGRVLTTASESYDISYPRPGWAEQDPEDWYGAACAAIRTVMASGEWPSPSAVSIAGTAHNVALLDERGHVLRPTIHWSDLRSAAQAEKLEQRLGERIFDITYQRVNPSWTLAQLLWLRDSEPSVWSALDKVQVTKDYIRYRLTGEYATDPYDAIGTQLFDVASGSWSAELCELLGFDESKLPPVLPPAEIAGTVTPRASSDTGLPVGTPVAIGSADTVVEAFGVGAVRPGDAIAKLGSAANANLVTQGLRPSTRTLTYHHVVPEHGFSIAATNAGTVAMRWFRDVFFTHAGTAPSFGEVVALAEDAPPGSAGLIFHPYLMGERTPHWDPNLRADFVGISAGHGIAHFARAVLEGVAFSLRECALTLEQLGQPIDQYRLLGGGSRSPLWRRILCDVFGTPLLRPQVEDASFGCALLGGVATGVYTDWNEAIEGRARIAEVIEPDPVGHARYEPYFEVFRDVTSALAPHARRLVQLAEERSDQ